MLGLKLIHVSERGPSLEHEHESSRHLSYIDYETNIASTLWKKNMKYHYDLANTLEK